MKLRTLASALLLSLALTHATGADAGRKDRLPRWTAEASFTASLSELARSADDFEVEPGSPAKLLFAETRYEYDAQGNARKVQRSVFQVLVPDPGRWGELGASWDPWRQERPELRARVLSPDGEERTLDPSAAREMAASQMGASMYSDARVLVAALPGIEPGAIVETEILTPVSRPMLEGLGMDRYQFGYRGIPVRYERLVVSAPKGVEPRWVNFGIDGPKRKRAGDRVEWVWALSGQEPYGPGPALQPYDRTHVPVVNWTLVESWAEVALAYHQIVEQQIGDADLAAVVAETTEGLTERDEIIAALTARVHRDARYTGLELDEAAVVPRTPEEVFSRGYGDCKDKAALLVALLREAGIDAWVVLLRAGADLDVSPDIPGPNLFNHAIAVVPGEPDVWIDVTAEFHPAGVVPVMDQGRHALIASPDTTALVTIPVAAPSVNQATSELRVDLTRPGLGSLDYSQTSQGEPAASSRNMRSMMDARTWQESLQDYAESYLLAQGPVSSTTSDVDAVTRPYEVSVIVPESGRAIQDGEQAVALLLDPPASALTALLGAIAREDISAREAPVLPPAQRLTFTATLTLPPGFGGQELPDDQELGLEGLRYTRSFAQPSDDTVVVTSTYEATGAPLSAEDIMGLGKEAFELMMRSDRWPLDLHSEAGRAFDDGRHGEALSAVRTLTEQHPDDAALALRHAKLLHTLGFLPEALAEAERAAALDPRMAATQSLLAELYLAGGMGHSRASNADQGRALSAARRAWELTDRDGDLEALLDLAMENPEGEPYGPGADMELLLELIDEAVAASEDEDEEEAAERRYLGYKSLALMRQGRYDEVADLELVPTMEMLALGCDGRLDEAVELARSLPPQQRPRELESVRNLGLSFGCYDALRGLDEALDDLELEDWAKDLTRAQDLPEPETLEEGLTRALVAAAVEHREPELEHLSAGEDGWAPLFMRGFTGSGRSPTDTNAYTDIALSLGELAAPGDPEVGQVLAVTGEVEDWKFYFFAVVTGDPDSEERVFRDAGHLGLWRAAADHLAAGDREAAKEIALLGTSYIDLEELDTEDPLQSNYIGWLAYGGDLDEPGRLEGLVGAALSHTDVEADLRRSLTLLDQAEAAGVHLGPLARARLDAYRNLADREGTAQAAAQMLSVLPEDEESYWKVYLGSVAGDDAAVAAIIDATWPNGTDPDRFVQLARAATARGDAQAAIDARAKAVELSDDDAHHYNEMAWFGLFLDEPPDAWLEWGAGAVAEDEYDEASAHTLAAIHLALGDPDAASVLLQEYLQEQDGYPPGDHWYLILGGLAEAWGLPEAARRAYEEVEPSPDIMTSYALAHEALAGLDASEP
ncbi:MAG: DUF3857 domain-containing protein [Alphaproteobacteria bacterium]|nr:DUF3857 domain-containing protein [Alphaproteobacteria bacterium]